jgi:poly(3-hydroxyalkanoate) synthetase
MSPGDDHPLAALGFLWPAMAAASASAFAVAMAQEFINLAAGPKAQQEPVEPAWATPGTVLLELDCVRLRGFGTATEGVATLICAPFALHAATITDIAPGHSLVATLQAAARGPVFVTDWRSADTGMGSRSIDDYIADLNVVIDELGGAVDLIGLCQGGWMGLVYAARFPQKVRKLVLAGAPIDIAAGQSSLSQVAQSTPMAVFKELVALGGGRMLGHRLFRFWEPKSFDAEAIRILLESSDALDTPAFHCLETRFREWYAWTVDLPGRYYLEVVERLYLENQLATGRFTALGRRIGLSGVKLPIYLLVARDDHVVAPAQMLAVQRLVGTPPAAIRHAIAPCGHLGLFMGKRTLAKEWLQIGRWLKGSEPSISDAA